jgi:flavorubredoxin
MVTMKAMVIFESAYGNTELVARTIAASLEKFGNATLVHAAEARALNIHECDILIIGSPTQLHKASPTVNEWLDGLLYDALQNFPVATFDTRYQMPVWRSGSAAQLIAKRIQKLGAVMITDPESFYVTRDEGNLMPGELERVPVWADHLYKKFIAINPTKR